MNGYKTKFLCFKCSRGYFTKSLIHVFMKSEYSEEDITRFLICYGSKMTICELSESTSL